MATAFPKQGPVLDYPPKLPDLCSRVHGFMRLTLRTASRRQRSSSQTPFEAKSVAEDLPTVLRRIEHWHEGSVAHLQLTVLDSAGRKAN
jgi:hypothetical protein